MEEFASMHLRSLPMFRILLPLLAGICFSRFVSWSPWAFGILFLLSAAVAVSYHFRLRKNPFLISPPRMGRLWSLVVFTWAAALYAWKPQPPVLPETGKEQAFLLEVLEEPQWRRDHWRVLVQPLAAADGDTHRVLYHTKAFWHLPPDTLLPKPLQGAHYLVRARVGALPAASLPEAFDYKDYLQRQGIWFQLYQQRNSAPVLEASPSWNLSLLVTASRNYFLEECRKFIPGTQEAGVAEALLFGYKEDLDPEVVSAFSNTGTLHVLAVSGMHIGLFYLLLSKLLFFLEGSKRRKNIQLGIILLLLWFYAMLTGMSASVLRAVVMFSFMATGKVLERPSQAMNSLAAAAVVILCYDPAYLFDVGFQLSFLAVAGILLFHKWIASFWIPRSFLLQQAWEITSLSLASQWATFPLGLLYFHQFPNYFLFSNLLIIPLTTLAMYLGIGLLSFSWIPILGTIFGWLVSWVLWLSNYLALLLEKMPGAMTDRIWLDITGWLLLTVLVGLVSQWCFRPTQRNLAWSLLGLQLLLVWSIRLEWNRNSTQTAWMYAMGKTDALLLRSGRQSVLYVSGNSEAPMLSFLKTHWTKEGLLPRVVYLDSGVNFSWKLGDKSCYSLQTPVLPENLDSGALIRVEKGFSQEALQNLNKPALLVLGASLDFKTRKQVQSLAAELSIPYYCLRESGSLPLNYE